MGQRAVAQLGSALDWGSRGRRFKSCQPDGHASEGPSGPAGAFVICVTSEARELYEQMFVSSRASVVGRLYLPHDNQLEGAS